MHRLALHGWNEDAERLLDALRQAAGIRLVAVGDRRASALVQARSATGAACYQHPTEMFRLADYDIALLNAASGAAQAARSAGDHGAAVLLQGSEADGATLATTAEAALRAHVPFAVLRPRLQHTGLAFLADLAAADPGWRPRYLDLALSAPDDADRLIRDAVAFAGRMMHGTPATVSAQGLSPHGASEATHLTSDLRYGAERLASLRTRAADEEQIRLFADCALGELELRSDRGTSTLTMRLRDGRSETSQLAARDVLAVEATRVANVLSGRASGVAGGDSLAAPHEGAVLAALEQAIETGQRVAVEERSSRANLVLMESRGDSTSGRSGRLRLVGV